MILAHFLSLQVFFFSIFLSALGNETLVPTSWQAFFCLVCNVLLCRKKEGEQHLCSRM